jgi:hypothetical protein
MNFKSIVLLPFPISRKGVGGVIKKTRNCSRVLLIDFVSIIDWLFFFLFCLIGFEQFILNIGRYFFIIVEFHGKPSAATC